MTKIIFATVEPEGLLDEDSGEALRQKILEVAKQELDAILLDLGKVTFMNSYGLGMLASTYTTLKKMGKELYLCSLNEQIKMLFELTSMDSCFKIYEKKETFEQENQ